MSDILIASPLGLRTLLAEEFDFLSSIEVLIMDQTDILYMQVSVIMEFNLKFNKRIFRCSYVCDF